MSKHSNDPAVPSPVYSDWREIVNWIESFPFQRVTKIEGEITNEGWIFRGLADRNYELEPSVERQAHDKCLGWFALERFLMTEFKSRAHLYLKSTPVTEGEDEFTWLALMQHYAVPTRLLDFTFSPYVALYFAVRGQKTDGHRPHVRIWAIDRKAVNERFRIVSLKADLAERKRAGEKIDLRVKATRREDFRTEGDDASSEIQGMHQLLVDSLAAKGTRRVSLEDQGWTLLRCHLTRSQAT